MFKIQLNANRERRGFSLVELAIVLGVSSILFAGLWRLMASGNAQMRDQTAAEQQGQLIQSVKDYLASSNGQTLLTNMGASATSGLSLPGAGACTSGDFCDFLPTGFRDTTTNSYGQTYSIRLRKDGAVAGTAPTTYSFMILTQGGEVIPDTSGGRISSMIGGDGGFIYAANVCGANWACGSYGSWSLLPSSEYGFGSNPNGHVASRTYISGNASTSSWLARIYMPGPDMNGTSDFNTLQTDTSLGGNTLFGNGATGSAGGRIENLQFLSVDSSALGSDAVQISGTDGLMLVSASTDTGNTTVTLGRGNCSHADARFPGESVVAPQFQCDYTLQVNGGQAVTGLLKANRLYAAQFLYNTSDRRLKHDVKGIDNALEKVASLKGYSFFLNKEKKRKYGVIAQDVQKNFPEIVGSIGQGYIGVDYMGLIGPIIAAVSELKDENDALKADLKELRDVMTKAK